MALELVVFESFTLDAIDLVQKLAEAHLKVTEALLVHLLHFQTLFFQPFLVLWVRLKIGNVVGALLRQ